MARLFLLACLSVIFMQLPCLDAQVSDSCELFGYDIESLRGTTWTMTLEHKTDCIVPTGSSDSQITSCSVMFSVCDTITCGAESNSSMCMKVTVNGTSDHFYNIGGPSETFKPKIEDAPGFLTVRVGDNITSEKCNEAYNTIMIWECNMQNVWNPHSPDVSHFITDESALSSCTLNIELGYKGACYEGPTLVPDDCSLQPYDTSVLTSEPYWVAELQSGCYPGSLGTCTLTLSFCQAIPSNTSMNCLGASVCLTSMNAKGDAFDLNLGKFNTSYTRFYPNVDTGIGGFHMDVENGSIPTDGNKNCVYGLRSTVVLLCDQTASWNRNHGISHLVKATYDNNTCHYVIDIQYPGACITVGPTVSGSKTSFFGWIFIAVFAFAVIVYLLVGTAFQYFVKGAKGIEIIPNLEFWSLIVMLILEGCRFSLDIITCFQFKETLDKVSHTSGRGNVEYDKI